MLGIFIPQVLRMFGPRFCLAHADNLDAHPFWCAFIVQQMPMSIHAESIEDATAQSSLRDLEALKAKGEFSANFIVQAAVGIKRKEGYHAPNIGSAGRQTADFD